MQGTAAVAAFVVLGKSVAAVRDWVEAEIAAGKYQPEEGGVVAKDHQSSTSCITLIPLTWGAMTWLSCGYPAAGAPVPGGCMGDLPPGLCTGICPSGGGW